MFGHGTSFWDNWRLACHVKQFHQNSSIPQPPELGLNWQGWSPCARDSRSGFVSEQADRGSVWGERISGFSQIWAKSWTDSSAVLFIANSVDWHFVSEMGSWKPPPSWPARTSSCRWGSLPPVWCAFVSSGAPPWTTRWWGCWRSTCVVISRRRPRQPKCGELRRWKKRYGKQESTS